MLAINDATNVMPSVLRVAKVNIIMKGPIILTICALKHCIKLWRFTCGLFARLYLRLYNVEVGENLHMHSMPYCRTFGSGRIVIGNNVRISNKLSENPAGIAHRTVLVALDKTILSVGDHSGLSGVTLYGRENITIGKHCLLGANCSIYTTDFHPLSAQDRINRAHGMTASAPVFLEDSVWLCANVIVLKGVTIGRGSVIAAGSIVTRDIPRNVLAAGVPAKVIKQLNTEEKPNLATYHL